MKAAAPVLFTLAMACSGPATPATAPPVAPTTAQPAAVQDAAPSAATPLRPPRARLAISDAHTCFIDLTGQVWCWGAAYSDQLGLGNQDFQFAPTKVPGLADAVQIAVSSHGSCAVRSTGELLCWGRTPLNRVPTPTLVPNLQDVEQVALDDNHACALLVSGELLCWGAGPGLGPNASAGSSTPTAIPGLSRVVQFDAGDNRTCAVTASGELWCWGATPCSSEAVADPTRVEGVGSVVQVQLNASQTCSLLADGTVRCDDCNAPVDSSGRPAHPATTQLAEVRQLTMASYEACAMTADGQATCWRNMPRAGSSSPPPQPRAIDGLSNATQLAVEGNNLCALHTDNSVSCMGANDQGQIGLGAPPWRPTPNAASIPALSGVVQLVAGLDFNCARLTDGTVQCWGDIGHMLPQDTGEQSTPTQLSTLSQVARLSAGTDQLCAVTTDGAVVCSYISTTVRKATEPAFVRVPGVTDVVDLAIGGEQICAVAGGGAVSCWSRYTPAPAASDIKPVAGLRRVRTLVAGYGHFCAHLESGKVQCWGENERGQLGVGTNDRYEGKLPPTAKALKRVVQISSRGSYACAVDKAGQAWVWGGKFYQGKPDKGERDPRRPWKLPNADDVRTAAVGERHTCIVRESGTVNCWGFNNYGQLGTSAARQRHRSPTAVPGLTGVTSLAAGASHTCALLEDSTARCWGSNERGQLGDGKVQASYARPVTIWRPEQ